MRRLIGPGASARTFGLIIAAGLLGGGLTLAVPAIQSAGAASPDAPPAPTWVSGQYFTAIEGVAFCDDIAVSNAASLPLTSITPGTTPSGIANYQIENANLTNGTAQICGTDNNTPLTTGTPPAMAPVATNGGSSATDSIPIDSQNECTWTASSGTVSMFDPNQDLEQVGSQSAFGQPITNGETAGTSTNYPTCTGDVMVSASGGLGDAWTVNTENPLPTPIDTNPSAAQGDLASSNLELDKGCYGSINTFSSYNYTSMGSGYVLPVPSPWVNGGECKYGSLGTNSAGGNTDGTNATCPPSQTDVDEGYVACGITDSSGNNKNGTVNYSTMDLFFTGQPVPQQSTATLSASTASPGTTVSVTGGSNWWGNAGGAPNEGPYGDFQTGAMYQVGAPSVYIGATRASAVAVTGSTVAISANSYVCTGAESTTVGPNPCTMTPGQPSGTFQIPSGLAPGSYDVYIDESNTTPLPGNGPNDAYQTARGTSLGTAESITPIVVRDSSTDANGPVQSTITEGQGDTDTATVTGSGGADPTGSVAFYQCGPASGPCTSGTWTKFDTESLGGTSNPASVTSASFVPDAAGEWCFGSVYSGDSDYLSSSDMTSDGCFDVETPPGSTSVTDTPTASGISLGSTDTDTATVTGGGSSDPSGTVDFYECGPEASPAPCTSGSWAQFDTESLAGSSNPGSVSSTSFEPASDGYWCFTAAYGGNTNYKGSTDATTDGCFDVTTPLAPSSVTDSPASATITQGKTDSDTASVTGNASADPTGTVDFYECGPDTSPAPCTSGSWTQFDTESLTGTSNPGSVTSASFKPSATGDWCFASVYLGDSHYEASSDTTVDGCFAVKAQVPAPTITSFSPESGKPGATVTIKGTHLAGAKVTIGTKVATVGTDTAGQIKITVPKGAKTGRIKVTTSGGTVTSKTNFKVT